MARVVETRGSVVVAGAVGVGKTRLVEEVVSSLATRETAGSLETVFVRATRSMSAIPFGPFVQWAPELPGDAAADGFTVMRGISQALGAETRRLLVVVDDAHLLDQGSAALVHHFACQPAVSVVVTVRTGEPCPDAIRALSKDDLSERVEIQALSEAETTQLAEALLGGRLESVSRGRLWQLTAGVPLYVREVVHAAWGQGVLTEQGGAWVWRGALNGGGVLGELIDEQFRQATEEERRALELIAVGEPLPVLVLEQLGLTAAVRAIERQGYVVTEQMLAAVQSTAARTADQPWVVPGRATASLGQLNPPAHAVDDSQWAVRLAHPLYGEVIRAGLARLTTSELCRKLAGAAESTGWAEHDPLRVAMLWLEGGMEQGACDVFLSAALRAFNLAEWDLAGRLAQAAERTGAGARATLARAIALVAQERWQEADDLFAQLASHDLPGNVAAEVAVAHARGLFWGQGNTDAALAVMTEAADQLPPPDRGHALAYAAFLAAFACRTTEAARLAVEAVSAAGDRAGIRVEGLAVAALAWMLQGSTDAAVAAAETALPYAPAQLEIDPNPTAVLPAAYGLARLLQGNFTEATSIAEATLALAYADDVKIFRGLASTLAGRIALGQGNLEPALEHGRKGMDALHSVGLPAFWPVAVAASASAQRGDADAANDALQGPAAAGFAPPLYQLELDLARAWLTAAEGHTTRARVLAMDVARRAGAAGVVAFELFALADVVRLGGAEAAVTRLGELSAAVGGELAPVIAAWATAAAAEDGEALAMVSERFEDIGAALFAAEAAAAAAGAYGRDGRRGSRITAETRARSLMPAGAATPALRGLEAAPLVATLTLREREVVELAARGITNREIADRLYVSVRTVHTHLGRAYQKLGVNDRTQLKALLEG